MQVFFSERARRSYTRRDPVERFWAKVEKTPTCWLWRGSIKAHGYGNFCEDSRPETRRFWNAHRYAWTIANGPVPDGMEVCHHCDVRHCVNPSHLFLGTRTDNVQDCIAKGRYFDQRSKRATRTHCKHGHAFTPENTAYSPIGTLLCRACGRDRTRRHRERHLGYLTKMTVPSG